MIYIVTALQCEAKPIIRHFNLSKLHESHKLPVYVNELISLVISGTGMIKSAVALTYLIGLIPLSTGDIAVNTGICGSANKNYKIGTPVLCNKITNHETGKSYYPDMLLNCPIDEGAVECFSKPVTSFKTKCIPSCWLVDMESAGFMEAASIFFPSNNIFCLKIVSDYLEDILPGQEYVSHLIEKNLHVLEYIIKMAPMTAKPASILTADDHIVLEKISNALHLTVTQKHQLKTMAVYYKIRHKGGLENINEFLKYSPQNIIERRTAFDKIKKFLSD